MMSKVTYNEIGSAEISKNRSLVISECSEGGFTLGQKLTVEEGNQKISVFFKGAIHIDDYDGLLHIKDAIDKAIKYIDDTIIF